MITRAADCRANKWRRRPLEVEARGAECKQAAGHCRGGSDSSSAPPSWLGEVGQPASQRAGRPLIAFVWLCFIQTSLRADLNATQLSINSNRPSERASERRVHLTSLWARPAECPTRGRPERANNDSRSWLPSRGRRISHRAASISHRLAATSKGARARNHIRRHRARFTSRDDDLCRGQVEIVSSRTVKEWPGKQACTRRASE